MKRYKHIFFDLDHTLWDFDTNSQETLTELYQQHSLSERGVFSVDEFIAEYRKVNDACWAAYRKGEMTKRVLRSYRFEKTFRSFGILDTDLSEAFGADYVAVSPTKTALMPHTLDVLDYLADTYQLHIITNGFEEVQHIKLDRSGIGRYFRKVITSEIAGAKKPSPKAFHYAFALAEAGAHESLMIGDSLESDIIGARGVAMDQVFFNPHGAAHAEEITHEIASLHELKGIL